MEKFKQTTSYERSVLPLQLGSVSSYLLVI